jgi:VWFA-related protein
MLRLLAFYFFVAAISIGTLAQDAGPKQSGVLLHSRAQLVVVDVIVTGNDIRPVHGLKMNDFSLLEDGKGQTIQSLEEHSAATVAKETKPAIVNAPGIFTNYTAVPTSSAINVLLLDTLNTAATDQIHVKDQIRRFLKDAKAGAPIAIFGLSGKLTLLQSFTADPELLQAAVNRKNTAFSALLDDPVSGGNTPNLADDFAQFAATMSPSSAEAAAPALHTLQQNVGQQSANQGQLRARLTLQAMNQLARYLSGMPGRKNLIWFSSSFPIDLAPDAKVPQPVGEGPAEEEGLYRETANMMTRAQVAVYPIDARGGFVSPVGDVSQDASKYVNDSTVFANDQLNFHHKTMSENETMLRLAEDTGGQAFLNDNNLAGAVGRAIDTGSNYYTITYAPLNGRWNGDYRRLEVRVHSPGVTLAYRRGYYADPGAAYQDGGINKGPETNERPVNSPMLLAMRRGAPDPTEITLKVRVLPTDGKPETKPAKGNVLKPGSKGPYKNYTIDLAADPYSVQLKQAADGIYHGYLQILTYVYDQDGRLINSDDNPVRANYSPQVYASVMAAGVPFHQEISVPMKGDYYLRIGLLDLRTNRVGAVEVPVAAVRNLSPLPPLTASVKAAESAK